MTQRKFYVTAVDGKRAYFLAGPYDTREQAESAVDQVREIACDHARNSNAGRAWFMGYGVSRATDGLATSLGHV